MLDHSRAKYNDEQDEQYQIVGVDKDSGVWYALQGAETHGDALCYVDEMKLKYKKFYSRFLIVEWH